MKWRTAAPVALVVACAALLTAAQDTTASQTRFSGGVELVQLDVSVLDRDRRPVRGLTARDFTVLVDGRPEPVVAFKAVDVPPALPAPKAAWVRDVAPDVVTNTRPAGRVVAILIDDSSFSEAAVELGGVRKARETALSVVNELRPDDLAAVLFTGYARTAQTFTSDRDLLRAAILDAPLFGADLTPDDSRGRGFCYCGVCSIEAIGRVSESLRSLSEQRKILMYISAGSVVESPRWGVLDECIQEKRDAMHDAIRAAHVANVTIQALDPTGLVPPRGRSASRGGVIPLPQPTALPDDPATRRVEFLRTMAETTGGRAVVNNNDPDRVVSSVLAESSSYYLLGVERSAARRDGQLHRLEVQVNRRGTSVQARTGYYDPTDAEQRAIVAMTAAGEPAIGSPLPDGSLPLDLAVAPFATGDGQAVVALVLGLRWPAGNGTAGRSRSGEMQFVASLFEPETGRMVESKRQTVALAGSAGEASAGYVEVLSRVPAPAGRYELRVGLVDGDDRAASVYTTVRVPDFSEAVSVSGLVLGVEPQVLAEPSGALADVLPLVPTARRVFRQTDRVTAFLRVYQRGPTSERTTATTRLIDANDNVLVQEVREIQGVAARAGRVADYVVDVLLNGMTPGEYLLSMDVEVRGETTRRTARFRVE